MIHIDPTKCIRCAGCVAVCPQDALRFDSQPICDRALCKTCGICAHFCPAGAITIGDSSARR